MNFNLSGLFGSNFIITIGIVLLMAGLIVYYCNSRFMTLEKNLHRQNQILANFIGNVQQQLQLQYGGDENISHMRPQSAPVVNELATEEAIKAVEEVNMNESNYAANLNATNKIEISDDETSDSDSESESDSNDNENSSSSDSESDNDTIEQINSFNREPESLQTDELTIIDNITESLPTNEDFVNASMSSIKVIAMPPTEITLNDISQLISSGQENNQPQITEVTEEPKDLEESSDDDYTDDSDNEDNNEDNNDDNNDGNNTKNAFEMLNTPQTPPPNIDFKKMSVAALREMLVERGLSSESDAKKMKKPIIIQALSK